MFKKVVIVSLLAAQLNCAAVMPIKRDAEAKVILKLAKPFLPEDPVILEAGAYNGTDTDEIAQTWPKGIVHAFEPQPEIFQQLRSNLKPRTNVKVYELGLSDYVGTATFYDSVHDHQPDRPFASGSLLQPKEHLKLSPFVKFNRQFEVPITTLPIWAAQAGVTKIDFMWLDLQGLELVVLKAAIDLLKTTRVVYTEVEFVEAYKGQHQYPAVKAWLEAQGFVLYAADFTAEQAARPNYDRWYGNAMFVKKELLK